MAVSRDEVFKKVEGVLVDALGVDEEDVTEEATLTGDLGAESIDFLDDILNNPDYVENGRMTPVGLEQLKKSMPHADFSEFESDPNVSRMPDLFTVKTIVNYVANKLETREREAEATS